MHQLIPAAPTASAGYAAISPDEVAAKIRFRARSVSNPLQLGTPRRTVSRPCKTRRSAALANWQSLVA
jgi:hypothetical protein